MNKKLNLKARKIKLADPLIFDFCCEEMSFHLQQGDIGINFVAKFREYSLDYLDGGSSTQAIDFCPWCGAQLPTSLRNKWFEVIERLGFEPDSSEIPDEMLSEAWWRNIKGSDPS